MVGIYRSGFRFVVAGSIPHNVLDAVTLDEVFKPPVRH